MNMLIPAKGKFKPEKQDEALVLKTLVETLEPKLSKRRAAKIFGTKA